MARPLFQTGRFRLRSGGEATWRINADMLDDHSLSTMARLVAQRTRPFGLVEGVPRGGLALAEALQQYVEPRHPLLLIVDDVLTTGASMTAFRGDRLAIGYVLFDRSFGARPAWIGALWSLSAGADGVGGQGMNEPSLEKCSKSELLAIAREQHAELARMRANKLHLEEVIAELERPQATVNVETQARALAGMLFGKLGDPIVDGGTQMIMGFVRQLENNGYELRLQRIRGWLEAWLETKEANEGRGGGWGEGGGPGHRV